MTERTRPYVRHGATPDERLRHVGWTLVMVRPDLGPCWEWAGIRHRNGYGKVAAGNGKTATTHHLAYEAWVGPIPDGLHVCHRCDNRACIRPEHLFLGTAAQNHADMRSKGRRTDPVKLTDDDVAKIRAAYTGKRGEQTALAAAYGVSLATTSLIVRGLHRRQPDGPSVA